MNIIFEGKYRSLTSFEVKDLPPLSIITGLNGVGKTQLLEMISAAVVRAESQKYPQPENSFEWDNSKRKGSDEDWKLRINGASLGRDEVSRWYFSGSGRGGVIEGSEAFLTIRDHVEDFYAYVENRRLAESSGGEDTKEQMQLRISKKRYALKEPQKFEKIERLEKIISKLERLSNKNIYELSLTKIFYYYPFTHKAKNHNNDITSFSWLFLAYHYQNELGKSQNFEPKKSTPPWEVLNEVLKTSGFPFQVNDPTHIPFFFTPHEGFRNNCEFKVRYCRWPQY